MRIFLTFVICISLWPFPAHAESTVERILRTKTIECGYIPYEPFIIKNANTGDLGGIVIDYVNTMAKNKGLAVNWTEVNIDQAPSAINSGRIDAYCIPASPDKHWAEALDVSAPFGALPYYVYVPKDSKQTMTDLAEARFVVVDGFALTDITRKIFPKAEFKSLPQITSPAEMYDQLRYGKADAHVNEHVTASNYMKNNPGIIRRLSDEPVMVLRMFMSNKKGDDDMNAFMKETFGADRKENEEILDELLKTYKTADGAYWLERQCRSPATSEEGWLMCSLE